MRTKITLWVMLAVIGLIALSLLAPPLKPPKARAQRISGVNSVRSVTFTLTNTNALPASQPGTNK